jgi:hypothetical protein
VLGSIVTAHAANGTASAYADGLSIALVVATTALLATAAIAMRLVPSPAARRRDDLVAPTSPTPTKPPTAGRAS